MDLPDRLSRLGARVEPCPLSRPLLLRGEIVTRFCLLTRGAATARYKAGKSLSLGPGDFFGDAALYEDAASDATVRAEAEGTAMLVLELERLRGALKSDAALRERLSGMLLARRLSLAALGVS